MYIIKGIIIIFIMAVSCYMTGNLWMTRDAFVEKILLGFATQLAVFNILCIPMNITGADFRILCGAFIAFFVVVIVWNVYCFALRVRKAGGLPDIKDATSDWIRTFRRDFHWMLIPAFVFIVFQLLRMVYLQPVDYGDDEVYLTMVNDIGNTNIIHGLDVNNGLELPLSDISYKYIFTSYFPYLAFWSKIFHFHPLLLCKSFMPLFFGILAYGVFWLMADLFFPGDGRRKGTFMFLVALMVEYGNKMNHGFARRMLLWTWNSKSVLYTILLPLLLYLCMKYMGGIGRNGEGKGMTWKATVILSMTLLANGAATLMGVGFSTIAFGLSGLVWAIQKKDRKIFLRMMVAAIPTVTILLLTVLYQKGVYNV